VHLGFRVPPNQLWSDGFTVFTRVIDTTPPQHHIATPRSPEPPPTNTAPASPSSDPIEASPKITYPHPDTDLRLSYPHSPSTHVLHKAGIILHTLLAKHRATEVWAGTTSIEGSSLPLRRVAVKIATDVVHGDRLRREGEVYSFWRGAQKSVVGSLVGSRDVMVYLGTDWDYSVGYGGHHE